MRRKSLAKRGSLSEAAALEVASEMSWISDELFGGILNKQGQGRTTSVAKPWAMRYVTVNVETGELVYHVDAGGYINFVFFILLPHSLCLQRHTALIKNF